MVPPLADCQSQVWVQRVQLDLVVAPLVQPVTLAPPALLVQRPIQEPLVILVQLVQLAPSLVQRAPQVHQAPLLSQVPLDLPVHLEGRQVLLVTKVQLDQTVGQLELPVYEV